MGTFLLESVNTEKKPIFNYSENIIDGLLTKDKKQVGERLIISLEFMSDGETSKFSDGEIHSAIWKVLTELKK